MSVYESLYIFHPVDIQRYMTVLKDEFSARPHPTEKDSWALDDPPQWFHEPAEYGGELSILSYNYIPLHPDLVVALINHPELMPPTARIYWVIEQDVIFDGTIADYARDLEAYKQNVNRPHPDFE